MKKILIGLLLLTGLAVASDIGMDGNYWAMTYYRGKIPFSEFKQMGVNGCMIMQDESADAAYAAGFPFYNEYVLPQIGYDAKVASMFEFIQRKYFADGEMKRLNRKTCLNDPAYWAESKKQITDLINKKKNKNPLAYCWGDECSITSYMKPFDYDFNPMALEAMRVWLKEQYGTIENLNAGWETKFATFDAVVPFTTDQAKERQNKDHENFSPWADHRTFMNKSFADFLGKCKKYAEAVDPVTPVGIAGCQAPSTFGGYDWWRLCQVMTFVEAYEGGNNLDMIRSFTDHKKVFTASTTFGFGGDTKRRLWERLLLGDRGTIIYDESVNAGKTEKERNTTVKGLQDLYKEFNAGIAKKIIAADRKSDPIAIHYSHASIQSQWMLETGKDTNRNWTEWKEGMSSRFSKNRDGWVKVIEDMALQFNFTSYEQIENGELIKGGYKIFIMPESVAISAKEAKAIEEFANAGGTVIGDCQIATMDEHSKRLKEGQLDKMFGIKRNGFAAERTAEPVIMKGKTLELRAAEPGITVVDASAKVGALAGKVPVVISRSVGKGKAIYLNFYLSSYSKLRLQPPREKSIRDIVREVFESVGVKSKATLTSSTGAEISGYEVAWFTTANPKEEYMSIIRNAAVIQDELGAAKEIMKASGSLSIKVGLPGKAKISDLRTGKNIGVSDTIMAEVDPYEPMIYSIIWQ